MSNSFYPIDFSMPGFPCPSLSSWICSNSCSLSQWCHPTISSFGAPFSSCSQSFPASGSFPMSRLFASSSQSTGDLASVQFSCSVVSDSLWPHGLQYSRLPCPSPTPEPTQTHVHCIRVAIQPSRPLSSPSPSAFNLLQHQGLFKWVSSLHQMVKVLEFQLQHQSFQLTARTDLLKDALVGSPCSPRDSQEDSPTPQFKSINSSALSFLHSPTLTSIHDHWKNHSLD